MIKWSSVTTTRLGSRPAVAAAGIVGFLAGASGLVAAQIADGPSGEAEVGVEVEASTSVTATTPDDSIAPTTVDVSVPEPGTSVVDTRPDDTTPGDTTPDTVPDTTSDAAPDNTVPDDTATSVPTTFDDGDGDDRTSTSVPTATDDGEDDTTSSVPTTIDDGDEDDDGDDDGDDDATSTSIAASLPAPFSETYASAGGSIGVTWTGTALVLDSIDPAAGYVAEIDHQSWDRIRVEFEHDGDDARIEIRLQDGRIRVGID